MAVVQVWRCAQCHRLGIDTPLDLDTPGTRDALWHLIFPTHEQRDMPLCARHGAPLWALEGLGFVRSGGTMAGTAKMPYHVDPRTLPQDGQTPS